MRTSSVLTAILAGLVLLAAPLTGQSAELTSVRVGYPSPSASFSPLFVAEQAHIFQKYGLSAKLLYLQGVAITQAQISGAVDFTVTGSPLPLAADVEGADLILVASSIDRFVFKVIVVPGITKPADLRGKVIGVTRFGSLTDIAIRLVLRKWHMNPDKDVKFIQVGRMTDMVAALKGGKIDAGIISDPTSFVAEKLGLKRLVDMADTGIDFSNTDIVVKRDYSQQHRDRVLAFLKTYIDATHRFLTDRELGIRALEKYTRNNDRDLMAKTYDLFASKYIKKIPTISLGGVETALKMIAQRNPKARNRKASEFVDTSFMNELQKDGFTRSIWR